MNHLGTHDPETEEEENYFISLSDLMTGVVFIFVILLCAFAFQYQSASRMLETASKQADEAKRLADSRSSEAEQARNAAERAARAQAESDAARKAAEAKAAGAAQAEEAARNAEAALLKKGEQADALTKLLRQRDEALRQMLSNLVALLSRNGVRVQLDPENGVLRLPDDLLFESGSDTLKTKGAEALRVLARELAPILKIGCSEGASFRLEAVFVEGHTDNVKIRNGRFGDNWDLSTARATGTYRTLIKECPDLETFNNPAGLPILGVSGYGENRPVSDNSTEEGRARNRRIDLRFLMAYPSSEELKKLNALISAPDTEPLPPK